uniref:ATP synthase CF0 subunit I n=1 Tax=Cephaleuros lagerheimii TaxID=2738443 RepID=UPI003002021E
MNLIEKILETNIINLTIVLVILISVVGNALTQSLASRKEIILINLAEADKKANEAQEKLRFAKRDFENFHKKLLAFTQNEIESLKKKKQEILDLSYSQQKKELIAKISNSALFLVKKRCNFDSTTSEKIANFYLNLWTAS